MSLASATPFLTMRSSGMGPPALGGLALHKMHKPSYVIGRICSEFLSRNQELYFSVLFLSIVSLDDGLTLLSRLSVRVRLHPALSLRWFLRRAGSTG